MDADDTGGHDHSGAGTTATIPGLQPGTDYRVQVRAVGDGEGAWSASVSGTTAASVSLALGSAGDDGTWHNGEAIEVAATFGESVTVTGTPRIAFALGTETKHLAYASGSPGTELVFTYTVASGDVDGDGIAIAANAMENHGGSTIVLTADGSTAAALDHAAVAASVNRRVDGGAASLSTLAFSNQPDGDYVRIGADIEVTATFDRPVQVTGAPYVELKFGEQGTRQAVYVAAAGTPTELVFRYRLVDGDSSGGRNVTVEADRLVLPTGASIRTGSAAASLTHGAVDSGKTVSASAPAVSGASVDGTTLTLTFSEALDTSAAPAASAFSVSGSDNDVNVTAVAFKSGDATMVVLTLNPAVAPGDSGVTVDYTKPAANPLKDDAGNEVESFSGQAVSNDTSVPVTVTVAGPRPVDGSRDAVCGGGFQRGAGLDDRRGRHAGQATAGTTRR